MFRSFLITPSWGSSNDRGDRCCPQGLCSAPASQSFIPDSPPKERILTNIFKTIGSRNTNTPYKSAHISFYTGRMNMQKNRRDNSDRSVLFAHRKDPFSSQGIIKHSAQGNKYFLSVGIPIALPLQTNHWLAGDTGLVLSLSLLGSSFEHLQHQSAGPDLSDKPDFIIFLKGGYYLLPPKERGRGKSH